MKLAVASGKGGVGKTTVAFELAAALDWVVVDADLGMADLPRGRGRGPDLHDVLAGRASPLEAVRRVGVVSVLPCGRSLAGARAADPDGLVDVVDAVAADYGGVVIDTPAGLQADAGLPLFAADACLLVTTPDPAALADAVRVREVARVLDAGLVGIAHNRASPADDAQRVERVLGGQAVSIPTDDRIADARAAGVPVARLAPESPAADGFEALAALVRTASPA